MNNSISLEVKASNGADITEVTKAMTELSNKLGIIVQSRFNGVTIATDVGGNAEALANSYYELAANSH